MDFEKICSKASDDEDALTDYAYTDRAKKCDSKIYHFFLGDLSGDPAIHCYTLPLLLFSIPASVPTTIVGSILVG